MAWSSIQRAVKNVRKKIVEEVKDMWRKKTLIAGIKLALVILGIAGIILLLKGKILLGAICESIFVFSILPLPGLGFSGLRQIPENKRWVVEFFGEFYDIYGPGLVWIIPILTKVKESVPLAEQRYPLWVKLIKIDFQNGSAIPKDTFAFVQVIGAREWLEARAKKDKKKAKEVEEKLRESVYRVAYAPAAVKESTITTVENASRSYLNNLTIEQGITEGQAGYDILTWIKKDKKDEYDGVKEDLENWGMDLRRVRVSDWDLDKAIIAAREARFKAQQDALAAESKARQKALESGGMHGAIKEVLVKEYGYPVLEAEKLAGGYVDLWKVTEEKALKRTQIQFQGEGGGGFYPELAKFVATMEVAKEAVKAGQGKERGGKERKEEKEEKEEEGD